jgi:hypothetical protein
MQARRFLTTRVPRISMLPARGPQSAGGDECRGASDAPCGSLPVLRVETRVPAAEGSWLGSRQL